MGVVAALPSVEVLGSSFCDTLGDVRSREDQTLVVSIQALVDPLDDEIDSSRKNNLCPCSASPYNLSKTPLPIDESIHTLVDPCASQGESMLVCESPTTSEDVNEDQLTHECIPLLKYMFGVLKKSQFSDGVYRVDLDSARDSLNILCGKSLTSSFVHRDHVYGNIVSSAVLRKDIVNLQDFIERLKNEEDQTVLDTDQIEKLTFLSACLQFCHCILDGSNAEMSFLSYEVHDLVQSLFHQSGDDILVKLKDHVVPRLLENIKSSKISDHHYESSATMTEDQLVELLDALLLNLHYLPKVRAELLLPSKTQYELLQNVFGNLRDFHDLIVNGCIENKTIECVLPQFQLMAERVGHFCFGLLSYQLDKIDETDEYEDKVSQVHSMLVHLIFEDNSSFTGDMPKDFIHYEKLFVLLARVGALNREVSILIRNLEENSTDEENMNKISCASRDLLENIELLKEDLKNVFLKVPADSSQFCFPMSDGRLFMTLLLRNLNDLLNSNAYSVALIKEEIGWVKEDLEHIRSFFGNVEQELYKDLWTRVLDVAYEAEHAINSILARDRGLLQLIFLLPDAVEKIKLVKKEVQEKIYKNTSIIFANSPTKPVENKSSIASKIIVGFEEETEWIIRKLTSGPSEVDVISIVGMPGLGKTTLAYKVYNEKSAVGHFDIRSWCTVDQERNEKKLLQKIFNQVIGLKERFSEDDIDDDVADKLRKELFGKRYLVVLDDMWDTGTWD
ncbi:hypothetical protein CQW23_13210 [Capsicum baccatum]|uniref:NB-ARC domain-containing protein n=1 Tax=Capsicum baccatum TaxID=33114 RepID=A0A2G2WUW5_CAPBA|nr:hypothetical protein CQW23_13210 [Capsicum baccatum]